MLAELMPVTATLDHNKNILSACMNKNYLMISLAISGVMAAATATSSAPKCSVKTLKGTYSYAEKGTHGGIPYAESGQEIYDGKGNITIHYTDNTGWSTATTATYTMSEKCIGESTYSSGKSYAIYSSPNGSEFTYVAKSKNDDIVVSGNERRVSTALIK